MDPFDLLRLLPGLLLSPVLHAPHILMARFDAALWFDLFDELRRNYTVAGSEHHARQQNRQAAIATQHEQHRPRPQFPAVQPFCTADEHCLSAEALRDLAVISDQATAVQGDAG